MSDSELSTPANANANMPDDADIKKTLRRVAQELLDADPANVTINKARQNAEHELGLEAGFFKHDPTWKSRSKEIVEAVVNDEPLSPEKPNNPTKATTKAKAKPAPTKAGTKRKSNETATKARKKARKDESDDEDELSEPPKTEDDASNTNGKAPAPEDDESDMSILIDEPPKKKRQKKSTAASEPKAKAKASAASSKPAKKAKAKDELSPDEEEIKRLQGWLVKCGLRKVWGKELAHCSTDKEKMKHLKKMLEDAGMTGRYSNEKASQIKESRELAAELEATQEFADRWGKSDEEPKGRPKRGKAKKAVEVSEEEEEDEEEDEQEGAKPARRLPKGLVDFGDSGDEESD